MSLNCETEIFGKLALLRYMEDVLNSFLQFAKISGSVFGMKSTFFIGVCGSLLCLWGAASCTSAERRLENNSKTELDPGETSAKKYCASCHLFPEPGLLDQNTWTAHTLPAMGYRFGIYADRVRDSLLEKGLAGRIVQQTNVFPSKQTISDREWELINQYYKNSAPEKLAITADSIPVKKLSLFQATTPAFRIPQPAVSALAYDAKKRQLYVADCSKANHSSIIILDAAFKPITEIGLPHPVSNLTLRGDTLYILSMGHFVPSDEPAGQLMKAVKNANGSYDGYQRVLKNLKRPVDVTYGDLNGDGTHEIVVCEFGNHTGSVSLFVKNRNGSFSKKVLLSAPGAIKVVLEDMDQDNKKDIVVLMSQGDEGLDIYFNRGEGKFERKRVLRFPAVYGSVSFCVNDINNDGFKDIIYVNGDNADASRILKPYHGLRVFINHHTAFEEVYFFPLHGAYNALVRDFDHDGDMDIATISFFADFLHHPEQGFVYFENLGDRDSLVFAPSVTEGASDGRWLTMIGGDLDRDGAEDIVLGSFTSMLISGDSMNSIRNRLSKNAQPLLVLRNTTTK